MSPNYPATYPKQAHCVWHIRVKNGSRILLEMKSFETSEGDDYVRVYDTLAFQDLIAL